MPRVVYVFGTPTTDHLRIEVGEEVVFISHELGVVGGELSQQRDRILCAIPLTTWQTVVKLTILS